jgi:hypothetical protein
LQDTDRLTDSLASRFSAERAKPKRSFGDKSIPALEEFLQVDCGPSIQVDRMRKLTLADYFLATLAVGIVIGFPVWNWISEML